MGRAGAGGGGGHSSGGGHSMGRSGGGHSIGGSSSGGHRAGSGGFGGGSRGGMGGGPRGGIGGGPRGGFGGHPGGGFGGGPRGPMAPPPRMHTPPPPRMHTPPPPRRGRGPGCGSLVGVFTSFIIIMVLVIAFGSCAGDPGYSSSGSESTTTSTIVREKLDTGNAYINDCIIDEIGWFDNISKTESKLKEFWEETGVQPFIILKDYDASLTTNADKESWTEDYYDANFDTENIFLYVYFAEQDVDNDVGYMTYVNGYQTSSVMDSEAVEIFWNNIDKYWYTDVTTDELFINAFNDTGKTIMTVSTTGKDIIKWILIVIAIIIVASVIIYLVREKNRRAKEKAAEDQKILNTPIHDMAEDELEKKYLNKDK